jgi:hypothetical protein
MVDVPDAVAEHLLLHFLRAGPELLQVVDVFLEVLVEELL